MNNNKVRLFLVSLLHQIKETNESNFLKKSKIARKKKLQGSGIVLRPNLLKHHVSHFHCCSSGSCKKETGEKGRGELRFMGTSC